MSQRESAYAKINLFLDVIAKRSDGYHDIGTLFQTLDAHDDLEAEVHGMGEIRLRYDTPQDYPVEKDLVYRAAMALRVHGGAHLSADLYLHKRLPLGAGLGGGSADAAATLRLLNRMWNLNLPTKDLCDIGAKLGADVPFLIEGGTQQASGIGEILAPQSPARLPKDVVLVVATPHCAVPTKAAYSGIRPSGTERWDLFRKRGCLAPLMPDFDLFNKFEESVLPLYPQIATLKEAFSEDGALRTLMSGSGASVFAFFQGNSAAENALEKRRLLWRWGTIAHFVQHC
ncbi:MAG TPA: 4-(cytidine 5'-diphospho)-2-C-methyl-D-erythritol kinase [Fibrobacteraceae bacterium]|nr:4-(cytidine 5'-diphospho)-2-C-methyl-D-erythritol kinase [Fibrobacteraceae bacterium]